MPIARPIDDLPNPVLPGAPVPTNQTWLAKRIADQWWKEYQAGPDFTRDAAMPELPLRASLMGIRCDRALWYILAGYPATNPPGPAAAWRMRMGQIIGNEIAAVVAANELDDDGNKHGWWSEDVTDLQPIGYPGSSHADLIYYEHGVATIVGENKSQGGFGFKLATTSFKGAPGGPKWEHVMQAAIVAVVREVPKIAVLYISPEAISPDVAARNDLDEYGKFIAEWQLDTSEFVADVYAEVARQNRVLRMATPHHSELLDTEVVLRPERTLSHPDFDGLALVDNPVKGHWVTLNPATGDVKHSGTIWYCGYCNHQEQCIVDGPESVQVEVMVKA